MTGIITITTISNNITSLNLYSNVDGFVSAFETNIPRSSLISGYSTNLIPTGTTIVRASSAEGPCTNYIECVAPTTTTTTTTVAPTTTTTTTTVEAPLQSAAISSSTDIANACGLLQDSIVWVDEVKVGGYVYINSDGSQTLIGNGEYYHLDDPVNTVTVSVRIASNGQMLVPISICS